MTSLTYVRGDVLKPVERPAVIAHVCNDRGGWGAGFVLAVSRMDPRPEAAYREWAGANRSEHPFKLGEVQFVPVEYDEYGGTVVVANMLAQSGFKSEQNPTPIRYAALRTCLNTVDWLAEELRCGIHVPRIGCGLSGGTWDSVARILESLYSPVTVYDL